ncbi:MAG: hypothetical protein JXR83_07225 [Deltaproteobacteria bacterium]|nr:hypothetical protein [Deltaproteobacteria bacterium]
MGANIRCAFVAVLCLAWVGCEACDNGQVPDADGAAPDGFAPAPDGAAPDGFAPAPDGGTDRATWPDGAVADVDAGSALPEAGADAAGVDAARTDTVGVDTASADRGLPVPDGGGRDRVAAGDGNGFDAMSCTPQCAGRQCGWDGCGGLCGFCDRLGGEVCSGGQCVSAPSDRALVLDDYSYDYCHMIATYGLNRIQVGSDQVVLQEWAGADGSTLYAGHLGGFWALPYFSGVRQGAYPEIPGSGGSAYDFAFNVGLAFSNEEPGSHHRVFEQPSACSDGRWFPSKLRVVKDYPAGDPRYGHEISATKFGIPGRRAFANKVNVRYYDGTGTRPSDDMGVGFWVILPSVGALAGSDGTWLLGGCETAGKCASTGQTQSLAADRFYYYDSVSQVCMPFRALASAAGTFTWRLADRTAAGHQALYDDFVETGNVGMSNTSQDTAQSGSELLIHFQPQVETAGTSFDVALLVAVGVAGGAADCGSKVAAWLGDLQLATLEADADAAWVAKLNRTYQQPFPKFHSVAHPDLDRVYLNGYFHLPLATFAKDSQTVGALWNGYETLGQATYLQMIPFFGKCGGLYPWSLPRFSFAWALADPDGLREQIIKFLALDHTATRAYDNLLGQHRSDVTGGYSWDYWAMAEAIHDYVTVTGDREFLGESHAGAYGSAAIIDHLAAIVAEPESMHYRWDGQKSPSSQLIEHGADHNLWEYQIHCQQGGKLNGFTASLNAARYEQYRILGDLYAALGRASDATGVRAKADAIREQVFARLWDGANHRFNTYAVYQPTGGGSAIERSAYTGAACGRDLNHTTACQLGVDIAAGGLLSSDNLPVPMPLHTLAFSGFWHGRGAQQAGFVAAMLPQFDGPSGFTSLPLAWEDGVNSGTDQCSGQCWCYREDWHGPGLYTGEVGHILRGLFREGFADQAWAMLQKYLYLKDAPFWSEALSHDVRGRAPFASSYANLSYVEGGIGFTQIFIEGLFGVGADASGVLLQPRIPVGFGETWLTDLQVQGHRLSLHVDGADQQHQVHMCVACQRDGNGAPAAEARLRYDTAGPRTVVFTFANLIAGSYRVLVDGVPVATASASADGELGYVAAQWSGPHAIAVSP